MIIEGNFAKPKEDVLARLMSVKGDLEEHDATIMLAELFKCHPYFCIYMLTGRRMFPFQWMKIKMMWERDFVLDISSRGGAKCIDPEALVFTKRGMMPIKNVLIGDYILAEKEWRKVTNYIRNPLQKGRELIIEDGHKIKGKTGHRTLVLNRETFEVEYKKIEEIKEGDYVPHKYGMDKWVGKDVVASYFGVTPRPPALPCYLDRVSREDLYWLLGVISSTGKYDGRVVHLELSNENIYNLAFKLLVSICPERSIKGSGDNSGLAQNIEIDNGEFVQFLEFMGARPDLPLPDKISTGEISRESRDNVCAFLSGCFDGRGGVTPYSSKSSIYIKSGSKDFLGALRCLLNNVGVTASIDSCNESSYSLEIRSLNSLKLFSEFVSFRNQVQKKALRQEITRLEFWGEDRSRQIPIAKALNQKYGVFGDAQSISLDKLEDFCSASAELSEEDRVRIEKLTDGTWEFLEVLEVKKIKTESIDVTVEEERCFWADGFIHHNTSTAAFFVLLYAIFNPGIKILNLAPSMKQAILIINAIQELLTLENAHFLRQIIDRTDFRRSSDRTSLFIGHKGNMAISEIFCLPLGSGTKIRGARAQVIIIDEAFAVPEVIIDEVIAPMMAVNADIDKRRQVRAWEDKMIRAGAMKEEDRKEFKNNKLIMLSSASFEFEPLYKRFQDYIEKITEPDYINSESFKENGITYGIINLGWEAFPEDLLQRGLVLEQKNRLPKSSFMREYEAQFAKDSDSFFSMKSMTECSLKMGEYPTIEIKGDDPNEWGYIMAIDPNYKNAANSDHFAICLLKFNRNNTKKGYVVHSFAAAGVDMSNTLRYFKYLFNYFSIDYVIIDNGGGPALLETMNNSTIFKEANLKLEEFEACFDDEKSVRESAIRYNKKHRKMVHFVPFTSTWIRSANEDLQMDLVHKRVMFGAPPIDDDFDQMLKEKVPIEELVFRLDRRDEYEGNTAEEKRMNKRIQFIEHQNDLINLTKEECANIQISATAQGHQTFDLPPAMKRVKGPDRPRKDSYSALLLANHGLKCYDKMIHVDTKKQRYESMLPEMF